MWDGCTQSSLHLGAWQSEWSGGPGQPIRSASAFVSYYVYDACTGQVLVDLFGWQELAPRDFSTSGSLRSATLATTIDVYDWSAGTATAARLEVSWTAELRGRHRIGDAAFVGAHEQAGPYVLEVYGW